MALAEVEAAGGQDFFEIGKASGIPKTTLYRKYMRRHSDATVKKPGRQCALNAGGEFALVELFKTHAERGHPMQVSDLKGVVELTAGGDTSGVT